VEEEAEEEEEEEEKEESEMENVYTHNPLACRPTIKGSYPRYRERRVAKVPVDRGCE
jgi:hypothetical protein